MELLSDTRNMIHMNCPVSKGVKNQGWIHLIVAQLLYFMPNVTS